MSYSNKYIQEKLQERHINESFFAPNASVADKLMQGSALASVAAPVVIGGFYAASDAIGKLINNFKYRKKNCDLVLDPSKKQICLNIQRKALINNLIREKSKCPKAKDPRKCSEMLDNQINKLRQQDMEQGQGY